MDFPKLKTYVDYKRPLGSIENIQKRRKFQSNFSWAIPSVKAVKSIVDFSNNETIYEIGAGKGYWAYFIDKMKGKIKCFDNPECVFHYFQSPKQNDCGQNITDISQFKTFYPVDFCTPKEVFKKCKEASVLMLCWPEYDKDWAYEYLKKINPKKLIYIGEEYGGCCANDAFFDCLEKNYKEIGFTDIPQWEGIHDYCFFYERK